MRTAYRGASPPPRPRHRLQGRRQIRQMPRATQHGRRLFPATTVTAFSVELATDGSLIETTRNIYSVAASLSPVHRPPPLYHATHCHKLPHHSLKMKSRRRVAPRPRDRASPAAAEPSLSAAAYRKCVNAVAARAAAAANSVPAYAARLISANERQSSAPPPRPPRNVHYLRRAAAALSRPRQTAGSR